MKKINKLILIIPLYLFFMLFYFGCEFSFQMQPDKYFKAYFYCQDELIETKTIKMNDKINEPINSLIKDIEGYTFVGWDINNDDEVDELPNITENINIYAIYRENRKYAVSFYLDNNLLIQEDYSLNQEVNTYLDQVKNSDEQYNYRFLGWDVNNDGICETFPYKVTNDLKFVAIFEKTLVEYNYKIYDGDKLLVDENLPYGSKIEYLGEKVKFIGDKPYYLIGFDINDDKEVDELQTIKSDMILNAVYSDTQLLVMNVDGKIYVEHILENQALKFVDLDLESAQKCVWYLDDNFTTYLDSLVMPKGNLYIYGKIEKTFVIDTSLLDYAPNDVLKSKDDFFMMFNYLLFNRIYNKTLTIDFECDLNTLLDEAVDNSFVDTAYNVSSSYNQYKKELTLNFSYSNINNTGSYIIYEQYKAFGLLEYPNTRGSSFNNFYIDSVEKTYNVSNSEQLYYCLEHGYRPIISNDNVELLSLYNKMKDVLRLIIDDNMNDYQKALAIYEWLIMEVTYDKYVFDLVVEGNSASKYHCFYLEGVFNEKLAVCDGISKAYASLANMEGIPCVRVTGVGSVNHAWNKICINNNWYVVDATSGGTIVNGEFEIMTHSFFLVTDEYYKDFYREDGEYFDGIVANGEYNYYKNNGYTYNGQYNDFSCQSVDEMSNILKWFKSFQNNKSTIEMEINFDCNGEIKDELGIAQSSAKLYDISYMFDGKVLIILKK